MIPDARQIRELADEIIQLEDKLELARKRLNAIFHHSSEPSLELTSPARKASGRPPRDDSASSKILAEIDAHPLVHWDASGLSRHLEIDKRIVESALYNLHKAKKIARHSRGNYESLINPNHTQKSGEVAA